MSDYEVKAHILCNTGFFQDNEIETKFSKEEIEEIYFDFIEDNDSPNRNTFTLEEFAKLNDREKVTYFLESVRAIADELGIY